MSRTETVNVDLVGEEMALNVARTALFAALMGAFAYVSFPYPSPAPVTLQVLGVFLAALMLGPLWGSVAMVLYLLAGALGAPVFAMGSAGLGVVLGPTGGYLLSYPLATLVAGAIAHRGIELQSLAETSTLQLVVAMAAAVVVIYGLGVTFMWYSLEMTLQSAIVSGAVVFIPAEAVKMAAAIGIIRSDEIRAE